MSALGGQPRRGAECSPFVEEGRAFFDKLGPSHMGRALFYFTFSASALSGAAMMVS